MLAQLARWFRSIIVASQGVIIERDLRAEIDRLRALVKELADDLEAEVEGRHYRDTKGYPSELRRYERDIDSVKRARAALEPKP